MKKVIGLFLVTLILTGCQKDDEETFKFAEKVISNEMKNSEPLKFDEMKVIRVVKFSNGTSKGVVCGVVSSPGQYKGYKPFVVMYKVEFGALNGAKSYALDDKILPDEDDTTAILMCK
ncbi:hypothetical protein V2154_13175 [Ewingella sp. CoE-038-23]|uniref:hypothetical protein n=1 Tax=Ewingella docleensis TaxID=3118588 RepID=UPI0033656A95